MNPAEAEALVERILVAIGDLREGLCGEWCNPTCQYRVDRERVASDLAVIRVTANVLGGTPEADLALDVAQREAKAGVLRTAALYGVEP